MDKIRNLNNLTDAELLSRFESGRDGDAFTELVNRHGTMVKRTTRLIVNKQEDSEDALQATFFALAKAVASGKFKNKTNVAAWLHGTALRSAKVIKRSDARWIKRTERLKHRQREGTEKEKVSGTNIFKNETVGS